MSRAISWSASRRLPSPTITRYASGHERRTCGHASSSVGWPFSSSRRPTTPTIGETGLHPVLVAQRAARLLVVVAVEVHAVVDERARRGRAALVDDLPVDRVRDDDQVVHRGRERADRVLVLVGADAGRVDRRDDPRPAVAGLAQRDRRLRAHELRAVHVVVDDVRADVREVRGEDPRRDRVVVLVDDRHVDARALELAHGRPAGERHDRHVVDGLVHPGHEVVDVLLGTAVGARRHDLDDADAVAPGHGPTAHRREAGVPGGLRAHRRLCSSDQQPLDWPVHGAPLVLVGLVAAEEVHVRGTRAPARGARSAPPSARPATGRGHRGPRRRCSTGRHPGSRTRCRRRSAGRPR